MAEIIALLRVCHKKDIKDPTDNAQTQAAEEAARAVTSVPQ
jgi:hypothetical protein